MRCQLPMSDNSSEFSYSCGRPVLPVISGTLKGRPGQFPALADLRIDSNSRLIHLSGKLNDLGRVVGKLSHQLHSSHPELVGFLLAVKGLCREFVEQYLIPAQCNCSGVLDNLSADIALCLFRVIQETLHNIAKHAHSKNVDLEVIRPSNKINLKISDDGVGCHRL